jgi:hypothetical protein
LAYKEEIIKEYNAYGTNLTPHDVVLAFPGNVLSYLSKSEFYLCDYTVFQGESEQNYAWFFNVIKSSYKWGTVYTLQLHISNGVFNVKTSTSGFTVNDKKAEHYYWIYESVKHKIRAFIAGEFKLFVQESLVTMKRHNKDYAVEDQEALIYACTEFLPELLPNRKGERKSNREIEREIEHEVENEIEHGIKNYIKRDPEYELYRKVYREAYLKAMRGGW